MKTTSNASLLFLALVGLLSSCYCHAFAMPIIGIQHNHNVVPSWTMGTLKKARHIAGTPVRGGGALPSSSLPSEESAGGTTTAASSSLSSIVSWPLVLRAATCALASVATWATVRRWGLTIVQASALQGLLGCILLQKPYALAYLCGTFAGMSAHPGAMDEAVLLALGTGAVLVAFDQRQWAVGRGGRLGLVAFLANVWYYALRKGPRAIMGVVLQVMEQLRPATVVGVAGVGVVLAALRQRVSNHTKPQNAAVWATQTLLVGMLLQRLVATGVALTSLWPTFGATLASTLLVWKSPYTVSTVTAVGLFSGFLTPALAPAAYMGAFIGMSALPKFGTTKFLRASVLSTLLLQLGLLGGFGGRLGFLAYLGVNFAM